MNNVADDILKGLEQAVEIQKENLKGKITTYELTDVKVLRKNYSLTSKVQIL